MRARQIALSIMFLIPGLGIASWVTRTPAIRDAIGASTAEMGFVLFGLSAGSMIGILAGGPLVLRLGARPLIAAGMAGIVLCMPVLGIGTVVGSPIVIALGLFLFGFGMGGSEIAMNVEGAEVERVLGRTFLPAMHGFFSLGTVIGASAGIVATAVSFPVIWHLLIVGIIALIGFIGAIGRLPRATGKTERARGAAKVASGDGAPTAAPVWKDRRLLLIGAIVLAMALAEGTANDWLPLIMVDGHGLDPAWGSAMFAIFAAAMTIGRFFGGAFVTRFGRGPVLGASALFAAIGLLTVSLVDNWLVALIAVIFWGLGASLGFPVALSAAGDSGPEAAKRVSIAATVGYIAFLVGPPALGLLGEAVSLRGALLAPMVLVLLAVLCAPAAGGRATRAAVPDRDPAPAPTAP
ncbi:MFS transporter [Leucobacter japonicus]|uniref:MFS transporter n=1 Tax=Leucobacter japonicus TaxID=1461259 RepID=UPI000AEF73B1|nr:MFS transporter [Leucobacter japonicus]